jgi:hypothetical protein
LVGVALEFFLTSYFERVYLKSVCQVGGKNTVSKQYSIEVMCLDETLYDKAKARKAGGKFGRKKAGQHKLARWVIQGWGG